MITEQTTMQASSLSSIAVIVVNYGTADLAIAAVESVLEHHHGGRTVEVHLVDNASPGDDADVFRRAHTERHWDARVTLHLEAENHGFGRGNNVVLRKLTDRAIPPDAVFLLNPDAQMRTETLDALANFLETRDEVAVAGCGICRPDGAQVTAAFRFPSARSEFVAAAAFGPISRLLHRHVVALPPDISQGQVDWVSGAAFMVRFKAVRDIGFFDPDFFLYYEEIDLMHRLTAAGWSIWHVSGADVVHEAGASTGLQQGRSKNGRLPSYWYDSWRLYFTKRRGRTGAALVAASRVLGWGVNILVSTLRWRRPAGPSHFLSDFRQRVIRPILSGRS